VTGFLAPRKNRPSSSGNEWFDIDLFSSFNVPRRAGVGDSVENEDLEMVKFLYGWGSKINQPDNTGSSVLTTTVSHKKFDVLDFLVASGADINMVNNSGVTPLIWGVLSNNKDQKAKLRYLEKFLTFKPKLDLQ
jgi:hypothetical protein